MALNIMERDFIYIFLFVGHFPGDIFLKLLFHSIYHHKKQLKFNKITDQSDFKRYPIIGAHMTSVSLRKLPKCTLSK